MKRRDFIGATIAIVNAWTLPVFAQHAAPRTRLPSVTFPVLPDTIAGVSLEQLRDDYRHRLFEQYFPFWDKGGYDKELGGFMCKLNEDGTVFNDEIFIWYQGRALWVYSFLYNNFGKDRRFLEIAGKIRDFMVKYMYAGKGKWNERVRRDGTVVEGVGKLVYGWLFAAMGLVEYRKAAHTQIDLNLAKESLLAAVRAYDDPGYDDTHTVRHTELNVPNKGLRSQGHSMVIVNILSQLLTYHEDSRLQELQREHVDLIMNRFWNPDFGIANEFLEHDYSRIPGAESHMFAGHSLEALWMVMHEAVRTKDRTLFNTAKNRVRRIIEMCWDYVFEGLGSGDFFVFDTTDHRRGPRYEVKTMWAHCEILIACMTILEYTGEVWAKEWYERVRAFTLRTMPTPHHGVWRQAVDRCGKDLKRVGVSGKRKGNFHQPRYMMLNLLSLERMIKNRGKLTPFPSKRLERSGHVNFNCKQILR